MFTNNFFYDNSQLNYGKHISKLIQLTAQQKKTLTNVLESVKINKKLKSAIGQQQLMLFRSIGLVLALAMVVFAFEWKTYDKSEMVTLQSVRMDEQELLDVPMTTQPPPPPPKKMAVNLVEVPDIEEIKEEIDIDLDIETNEEMTIKQVVYEQAEVDVEEETTEEVFIIVEKAPTPVGGLQAFYDFIAREVKYPPQALRANIGGKVFVQFVVNKDGSLTDFVVVKGVGLGCDEEAIRVLAKAPKWQPGKQRGKEVRVRMVVPINFIMKDAY